jgi:uncharacterized protein
LKSLWYSRSIALSVSCWLGLSLQAGARPIYSYFLFFPAKELSTTPDGLDGVPREDVHIPVGKGELSGWFFRRADSPYVVLVNHGNGGNMSHVTRIASYVLQAGTSVLIYDYRGYGDSKGKPSVKSICADGDAAYQFLRERGYRPEQIILYGQSLGCAVSCHIADKNTVGAMILQSGFSSLRLIASQLHPSFKAAVPLLVPDVLDNSKILSRLTTPVLIIHGDKDNLIPIDNATKLYAAAIGPKRLIVCKDAGHNLRETPEQLKAAIRDFIIDYTSNKFEPVPSKS